MKRKVNPAIIGLFVLVGLGLAVSTILMVSSSKWFSKSTQFVLYFDASLTGLEVGSPVKFRGVTIGSVKRVLIHSNQNPLDSALPVIIEISEDLLDERSDNSFNLLDEAQFKESVNRGLRAKVESQSLLTGLLYINLEFLPGTPVTYHQLTPIYREIPTAPLEVQIFQVDFTEMALKLNNILGRLDASLGELNVKELNRGITNLLASLNAVAGSPDLTNTIGSAGKTLADIQNLSRTLRSRIDQLSVSADQVLSDSRNTLAEVRGGIQEVRDILAPQAPLLKDATSALEEMAAASRAVADLAAFLKRHPNALITGRKIQPDPP